MPGHSCVERLRKNFVERISLRSGAVTLHEEEVCCVLVSEGVDESWRETSFFWHAHTKAIRAS